MNTSVSPKHSSEGTCNCTVVHTYNAMDCTLSIVLHHLTARIGALGLLVKQLTCNTKIIGFCHKIVQFLTCVCGWAMLCTNWLRQQLFIYKARVPQHKQHMEHTIVCVHKNARVSSVTYLAQAQIQWSDATPPWYRPGRAESL